MHLHQDPLWREGSVNLATLAVQSFPKSLGSRGVSVQLFNSSECLTKWFWYSTAASFVPSSCWLELWRTDLVGDPHTPSHQLSVSRHWRQGRGHVSTFLSAIPLWQEFSALPKTCSMSCLQPALYLRTAKAVHATSVREKLVWFTHTLHAVVQSL